MRLVRIGRVVWDVLAIADESGRSVLDDLGLTEAEGRMLATIETDVPLNGPPVGNVTRCKDVGDDILEFKEWGVRVLWFYDAGEPKIRRRIICTHFCPKLSKKEFQQEKERAKRLRRAYIAAKSAGKLVEPEEKQG